MVKPPTQIVAVVAPWLRRHRRLLAAAAGLLVATVAAALALPVGQRETVGAVQQPQAEDALAAAATAVEDLTPLLDSVRWGTSLREALAAAAQAAASQTASTAAPAAVDASAAALSDVRFVGYIAAPTHRAALLALPDGQVVRVAPGESLRDGRAVASVSDRTLTLTTTDDGAQVLPLFPPIQVPSLRSDADGSTESR